MITGVLFSRLTAGCSASLLPCPTTYRNTLNGWSGVGEGWHRARGKCNLPRTTPKNAFTLIELLVALLLFALISVAGVSLVETVIGVQHRTAERAARLAQIQRAMFLLDADFEGLAAGPMLDQGSVAITRTGSQGPHRIVYRLENGGLHRTLDGHDRVILDRIAALRLRFYKSGKGWQDAPFTRDDASRPQAIELVAMLTPSPGEAGGPLRRVIALPTEAPR